MNQEFSAKFFKEEFQDFDSVSTEAIFVGNHNFRDHSFDNSVQKGLQALSFEVEPRADILDEFMVRVFSL